MTRSASSIENALEQFLTQFVEQFKEKHNHLPVVEADDKWISPCEQGKYSNDANYWQPVKADGLSFNNVEQALELTLHESVKHYFTSYYAESVDADCEEGRLSLLFPWNEDDFARLQENIIGHILMKRKLKQPETVFFAVTDQEDFILSIENETGAVWVEQVGKAPHKKLSDNLVDFIEQLTPVIYK